MSINTARDELLEEDRVTSEAPVIIVSGLARCGSSMMMQMLHAGGVPATGRYPAFEDEHTSPARCDIEWLAQQPGRAVKLLDPHRWQSNLRKLHTAVIWMDRDLTEQSKSHAKLLVAFGVMPSSNRRTHLAIRSSLDRDRHPARYALGTHNRPTLSLTFESVLNNPARDASAIGEFVRDLGIDFDPVAAASVVRNRSPACYDGMMELELELLRTAP